MCKILHDTPTSPSFPHEYDTFLAPTSAALTGFSASRGLRQPFGVSLYHVNLDVATFKICVVFIVCGVYNMCTTKWSTRTYFFCLKYQRPPQLRSASPLVLENVFLYLCWGLASRFPKVLAPQHSRVVGAAGESKPRRLERLIVVNDTTVVELEQNVNVHNQLIITCLL